MTHTEKLEEKIARSGKKKIYLADKVGLSLAGFRNCCVNKSEFKASQIQILCDELGISDFEEVMAIFFAQSGALNATEEAR